MVLCALVSGREVLTIALATAMCVTPGSTIKRTEIVDMRRRVADEHAVAMYMTIHTYMTMTMMRSGPFLQREGPGSEPGNSLVCPDDPPRMRVAS